MAKHHVTATVNGDEVEFLCETEDTLLDVLRDGLSLTGSKEGCSSGDCGACSVMLDGRDLLKASNAELIDIRRHKMSMVFQHFALLPHLTVLGNIAFPLAVQGVSRPRREARARELIELIGLKGRDRYYPRELSGGQQQRVGIARSLAVEPEIWFLDEPFSALDPLIRREMQDELIRLQGVLKKTMVFITHSIDEAILLGDRVAVMTARPGRLKEMIDMPFKRPRDVEEVRADPRFTELRAHIWHQLHNTRTAKPAAIKVSA